MIFRVTHRITISQSCLILTVLASALSLSCGRPSQPQSSYLVYVSNEASGDLTVIDPDQSEPVATIQLGKRPRGIHAFGNLLYVALSGSPFAPRVWMKARYPRPTKAQMALAWWISNRTS